MPYRYPGLSQMFKYLLWSAPGERVCFLEFRIGGMRNCARDEGRPLGAGLQEQAPNHLKLPWSRGRVVSVKEKS
jgi:hypothetical protein